MLPIKAEIRLLDVSKIILIIGARARARARKIQSSASIYHSRLEILSLSLSLSLSSRLNFLSTPRTSRMRGGYAGANLLFINGTFNCPETEAEPGTEAAPRRVSMGTRVPILSLSRVKLAELRLLGLGILREFYRVSCCVEGLLRSRLCLARLASHVPHFPFFGVRAHPAGPLISEITRNRRRLI